MAKDSWNHKFTKTNIKIQLSHLFFFFVLLRQLINLFRIAICWIKSRNNDPPPNHNKIRSIKLKFKCKSWVLSVFERSPQGWILQFLLFRDAVFLETFLFIEIVTKIWILVIPKKNCTQKLLKNRSNLNNFTSTGSFYLLLFQFLQYLQVHCVIQVCLWTKLPEILPDSFLVAGPPLTWTLLLLS